MSIDSVETYITDPWPAPAGVVGAWSPGPKLFLRVALSLRHTHRGSTAATISQNPHYRFAATANKRARCRKACGRTVPKTQPAFRMLIFRHEAARSAAA